MSEKRNKLYSQRIWLNDEDSPSTGNAVAYDGIVDDYGEPYHSTFLNVSDCHVTAHLHKAQYDTTEDFLNKMRLLRDFISDFVNHLEKTGEENHAD